MDADSPGILQEKGHTDPLQISQQLNTDQDMSPESSSQSRSNSASPPSTTSSNGSQQLNTDQDMSSDSSSQSATSSNGSHWRAIYRLQFGAEPVNINPSEKKKSKVWTCSKQCKKKNQDQHQHFFRDSQALEKHIMRSHPDPTYNKFVCIWCDKTTSSPQQILDHLGQGVKSGGHAIMKKIKKNEMIRAVHKDTGKKFRVKRATNEFAWYICVPLVTSPRDSRSPSPIETVSNIQDNQIDSQTSPFQVDSSNQSQSSLSGSQNKPSGRPTDVDHGRPPDYEYPDLLMSGGSSRVQVDSPNQSQPTVFGRQNTPDHETGRPQNDVTGRYLNNETFPDYPDLPKTQTFSAIPG
eukprot:GFUD01037283.1.p1 GENE.GFUD01037283.1~~GFUD01037283.1.p1  ORF type:complete len:351 (+),score=88.04 GFUD01037283.1:82-1134(+)